MMTDYYCVNICNSGSNSIEKVFVIHVEYNSHTHLTNSYEVLPRTQLSIQVRNVVRQRVLTRCCVALVQCMLQ